MKVFLVLLSFVALVALTTIGYFTYRNYLDIHRPLETIESGDFFEATETGRGVGAHAQCPVGKEAISGGCSSDNDPINFVLSAQQAMRTREGLSYNNAWQCSFTARQPGRFKYTVLVNCK
jgi:hypothetical protein